MAAPWQCLPRTIWPLSSVASPVIFEFADDCCHALSQDALSLSMLPSVLSLGACLLLILAVLVLVLACGRTGAAGRGGGGGGAAAATGGGGGGGAGQRGGGGGNR